MTWPEGVGVFEVLGVSYLLAALFAVKSFVPQMGPCGSRVLEAQLSGSPVLAATTQCIDSLSLLPIY
jgi:hypothetical protein